MCKRHFFHFPSNLSSLLLVRSHLSQFQTTPDVSPVCRSLALEMGICLPMCSLPSAFRPKGQVPAATLSSLAVLPDVLQDEGQTGKGHAGKEQFCFLLDEYGVDRKLLNIHRTFLPSKYTKSHNAVRTVKKEVHRLV